MRAARRQQDSERYGVAMRRVAIVAVLFVVVVFGGSEAVVRYYEFRFWRLHR